jgi:hypothetical protein
MLILLPSDLESEEKAVEKLLHRTPDTLASQPLLICFDEKQRIPTTAQPGEIWTTKPNSELSDEEKSSHWVIVTGRLELPGGPLLKVAPLFSEPSMADASDAILPKRLMGFTPVVSLGLEISIPGDALDSLVTRLPEKEIQILSAFSAWIEGPGGECPEEVVRGIPALDHLDTRIAFHQNLAAELGYLQHPLEGWIAPPQKLAAAYAAEIAQPDNVITVDFSDEWAVAMQSLYADVGAPSFHQAFLVESLGLSVDVDARAKAGSSATFNVFDATGHESNALDGCEIRDGDGALLGMIEGHSCSVPAQNFRGAFSLVLNGTPLDVAAERH